MMDTTSQKRRRRLFFFVSSIDQNVLPTYRKHPMKPRENQNSALKTPKSLSLFFSEKKRYELDIGSTPFLTCDRLGASRYQTIVLMGFYRRCESEAKAQWLWLIN